MHIFCDGRRQKLLKRLRKNLKM